MYDFPDFCVVMQKTRRGKAVVVQMTNDDVRSYKNGHLAHRLRKLGVNTMLIVVQLRRGKAMSGHGEGDFSGIQFL